MKLNLNNIIKYLTLTSCGPDIADVAKSHNNEVRGQRSQCPDNNG